MVTVVPRTLKRGDVQLVTAVITDVTGKDISACVFEVAHILDTAKNDDQAGYPWETPHSQESATTAVRLVRKLVTAALVDDVKTKYRVFVRVTDNPEVDAVDCGTYSVVP